MTGTEAEATCWTVVRGAAAGRTEDRETFARWYLPVVSAYLLARWNGTPLVAELDDAVQEVFYDCFRENGALARADSTRPGGFRAFLFGVVRNIALRREAAKRRSREVQPDSGFVERLRAREDSVNSAFDRAWAMAVLREAQDRFRDRAAAGGEAARRRYDLLRLRFEDGLPVRKIAARLDVSADRAHKDYAKARQEFRKELLAVVAMHRPGGRTEVQREAANLIALVRPS